MKIPHGLGIAVVAISLAACATTNEMPLAQNMVRLDTQASGLLFTGSAGAITMKRAAEATIRRGYSHFRLEQASTSQGSAVTGVYSNTNGWANNGAFGASTTYTPMRTPTAAVGVTVIMFRATEPGARGAFDAADVLKKEGRV